MMKQMRSLRADQPLSAGNNLLCSAMRQREVTARAHMRRGLDSGQGDQGILPKATRPLSGTTSSTARPVISILDSLSRFTTADERS